MMVVEDVLSSNNQLLYHSLCEAWMNMKMSCFTLVAFFILKIYNLGLKPAQNYRGCNSYLCCVPGRPFTFYLVDGELHENIAMFSALDAKIILSFQCIFACLFNDGFVFEFSIEILFF